MYSRGNGFLAIVQVTKSANVAGLVFVVARNFHATHSVHDFELIQELLFGVFDSCRWTSFNVVNLQWMDNGQGHHENVRGGDNWQVTVG